MFDTNTDWVGLPAGLVDVASAWTDADERVADLITVEMWNTGWTDDERDLLPDLESLPPGPFLSVILESLDRSRLNGYDLVEVLKARERMVSHNQAESMRDMVEISHAAPGDAGSDPNRLSEAFEFASDEIRAALVLTRSTARFRMSDATDLMSRLPRVWGEFSEGTIDLPRARVIANGTSHLDPDEARRVAETVLERAPRLTTGQLAAWIRRLCVESDPEKANQRQEQALEDRRLVIEPTVDGTGNLHLYDIDLADARAIGKRVNAHMISLRKDGETRSHDNLRADITVDLLLGSDPTNGGKGLFDMRVDLSTLAGLDEKAAEIPGMGPVIADVARKFADRHPKAAWQVTVCDDNGDVVDVVVTSRRPNARLSRLVDADQPVCSFPGCRAPAEECDFDHLLSRAAGGATSRRNAGPKCRHDHILKDHGWKHRRVKGKDVWTSPLGHTYTTEKPP